VRLCNRYALSTQRHPMHLKSIFMSKASELLLDLAIRSAFSRVARKLSYAAGPRMRGKEASNGKVPDHSASDAQDYLQDEVGALGADMRRLGKLCREEGWDARDSYFWPDLAYQESYEETYHRNRRVDVKQLTPMIIHRCLDQGSKLHFRAWIITVGGSREVTDGYGQPAWEPRIWLTVPNSESLEEYSGANRETARALYKRIAGKDFNGVDTLGIAEPHPAECYSKAELLEMLEDEGTLPLLVSHEHGPLWDAFQQLSIDDPAACVELFDADGRYRNQHTGFWASRNCERFDEKTGSWYRSRDYEPVAAL